MLGKTHVSACRDVQRQRRDRKHSAPEGCVGPELGCFREPISSPASTIKARQPSSCCRTGEHWHLPSPSSADSPAPTPCRDSVRCALDCRTAGGCGPPDCPCRPPPPPPLTACRLTAAAAPAPPVQHQAFQPINRRCGSDVGLHVEPEDVPVCGRAAAAAGRPRRGSHHAGEGPAARASPAHCVRLCDAPPFVAATGAWPRPAAPAACSCTRASAPRFSTPPAGACRPGCSTAGPGMTCRPRARGCRTGPSCAPAWPPRRASGCI